MIPSPTELSYFLEVVSIKNISRASERLGITQPSLSLAIKRLETTVGCELLLRSKKGVSLTKAGIRFSKSAKDLLNHWQSVHQSIKKEDTQITGSYRLGAHVSVACGKMLAALPCILSKYSKLELKLEHDLSRRITDRVINFELDFGIVVNPTEHPDLVIRKLYKDRVNFFCREGEMNNDNLLLCYDPNLLQARWLKRKAKESGVQFHREICTNSLELIRSLVANKVGVGILPEIVAKGSCLPLAVAPFDIDSFIDTHALIYRADMQTSSAAKCLARAFERELKDKF